MREMIIEKLQIKSIDNILKLQDKSVQDGDDFIPSTKELYQRAFQFQNFVFGVYSNENELLAFCNCSIPTASSKKNLGRGIIDEKFLDYVGHINTIIVEKNWRRQGIAKKLIQFALEEFKQKNIKHIFVTVSPTNQSSLSLFHLMGFRVIEDISYGGVDRILLCFDMMF